MSDWRFEIRTEPRGKSYIAIVPRGSKYAQLGLGHKCEEFEREVARIVAMVLPVFPKDTMLGIHVVSVKKRPKDRIAENPARIPCPVKPDATNILKCVEDSLMRCRECTKRKRDCQKDGGHRFAPTLIDDARTVDVGCKTVYSAVIRNGPTKKSWRILPARVEVHVWTIE